MSYRSSTTHEAIDFMQMCREWAPTRGLTLYEMFDAIQIASAVKESFADTSTEWPWPIDKLMAATVRVRMTDTMLAALIVKHLESDGVVLNASQQAMMREGLDVRNEKPRQL